MRKQSKFDKLFKRDEILRSQVLIAGFVAFGVSTIFSSINIVFEFLNHEITLIVAKYALGLIGLNLLVFLGVLFLLTIAKKEFFNRRSALFVTIIGTIYFGIDLYRQRVDLWVLFSGLALITWILYTVVNYLFKDIYKFLERNF